MIFEPIGGYYVSYPSNIYETRGIIFSRTAYRLLRGMFAFHCYLHALRSYEQAVVSVPLLRRQQNALSS